MGAPTADFTFAEQLLLNLAGPLLSAVLIGFVAAAVTWKAQDRRDTQLRDSELRTRQMGLQATLVEDITQATEMYFNRLSLLELKGRAAAVSLDDALAEWRTSFGIISAKLKVYFPTSSDLHRDWGRLGSMLWTVFFLFKNDTSESRQRIWDENPDVFVNQLNSQFLIEWSLTDVTNSKALAAYDFALEGLLSTLRSRTAEVVDQLLRQTPTLHTHDASEGSAVGLRPA